MENSFRRKAFSLLLVCIMLLFAGFTTTVPSKSDSASVGCEQWYLTIDSAEVVVLSTSRQMQPDGSSRPEALIFSIPAMRPSVFALQWYVTAIFAVVFIFFSITFILITIHKKDGKKRNPLFV